MNMLKLKIEDLNTRDLQTRAALNEDTVVDYAEAMERGDKFPAVTVFTDGADYYLADGFHRVEALRRIGKKVVTAELQNGEYKDALLYALKANSTHGLRRTNADKRHALEMAWNAREHLFGGDPSQNLLADTCGISRKTVERFMAGHLATMSQPAIIPAPAMPTRPVRPITTGNAQETAPKMPIRRVGRDGKMYTVPPMPVRPVKSEVVIPRDRFGTEVPPGMEQAFETDAFDEVVNMISRARVALRNGVDDKNLAFAAVPQEALIMLNNAYNFVKASKAYCVCRICNGEGCSGCKERGFQTAEQYERNPKEYKA